MTDPTSVPLVLVAIREVRKPVKPATANDTTTCCAAAVSGVTRPTNLRGAAFSTCVFSGIMDRPIPSPIITRLRIIRPRPVSDVIEDRIKSAPEMIPRPTNARGLAPILSNKRPPSGIPTPDAKACGSRINPVSKAV
ncbi:hypothetical protein D3C76_1536090 [compost metagenome]